MCKKLSFALYFRLLNVGFCVFWPIHRGLMTPASSGIHRYSVYKVVKGTL